MPYSSVSEKAVTIWPEAHYGWNDESSMRRRCSQAHVDQEFHKMIPPTRWRIASSSVFGIVLNGAICAWLIDYRLCSLSRLKLTSRN